CRDVDRAGELAVCAGPSSGCTATDCEQQPEHHGKHKARWTTPSIQHATSPPKLERLQHGGARRRPAGLRAAHPTEHRPETVGPWAKRTALRSSPRCESEFMLCVCPLWLDLPCLARSGRNPTSDGRAVGTSVART